MDEIKCSKPKSLKISGTVNVGPKGQIVIPKEARDALGIEPGDSLLVLYSPEKKHIGIVKNNDLQKIIDFAKSEGITIEY